MLRGASVLLLSASAACDAAVADGSFRLGDSAGVVVAESTGPAWREGQAWTLAAIPTLELPVSRQGTAPPDVVAAVRLSDGTVAVADAGAGEVRFYAGDGALRKVAARTDGARLTFRALTSLVRLADDSLGAFDAADARVVVIAPDGTLARETRLAWPPGVGPDRAAAFADGTWVVRSAWRASEVPAGAGVVRAPVWFLRFDGSGELLDTVAGATGPAVATVPVGVARTLANPLLGPITVHAVHGDRLYVGTGEALELRVHEPGGALERLVRVPGADLSVTQEELDAARNERAAMGGDNPVARRLLAQVERSVPLPGSRPAYGDLLVDALGNAWVGEYPWLGPGGNPPRTPRLWTVFDPEGRLLGQIRVPDGITLLEVGGDYLLGLRRDSSGAQVVVLYGISR